MRTSKGGPYNLANKTHYYLTVDLLMVGTRHLIVRPYVFQFCPCPQREESTDETYRCFVIPRSIYWLMVQYLAVEKYLVEQTALKYDNQYKKQKKTFQILQPNTHISHGHILTQDAASCHTWVVHIQ